MHFVKLDGALAEVMVPATGGSEHESFRRWAAALQRRDVFGDQRQQVAALTHVGASKGEGARDDWPRIGILVHEARDVVNPEKEDLKSIVAEVEKMGGRPVLIPSLADLALPDDPLVRQQAMAGMLHQLDGMVGPGGRDLHPRLYRSRSPALTAPS